MKLHPLLQNSPEWHEFRSRHIGSSDAPIIMGHGYISLSKLYEVKMGIAQVPTTPAMRRGTEMEEEIRNAWNPNATPVVATSDKHPWMAASLDGMCKGRAVEIKTCGDGTWSIAQSEIPKKHWIQCQHILAVIEADEMDYILVHQVTKEKMQMVVQRDDAYIEKMIAAEKAFYDRLINFDAPEPEIKTVVNPELEAILIQLDKETAILKAQELVVLGLRQKAIAMCGEESVKCGDFSVRRQVRKGAVDYLAIPELKELNLEPYRKKESIFWTIKGRN